MVRAKPKELQYYGVFLIIPFLVTLIALILQMSQKYDIFDPTDWYLFGVSLGLLAVIVNLFLFVYEINRYGGHRLISTSKLCEENVVWIVMNWKINIKNIRKNLYIIFAEKLISFDIHIIFYYLWNRLNTALYVLYIKRVYILFTHRLLQTIQLIFSTNRVKWE